jgi:YVTN family beta-propeller protein
MALAAPFAYIGGSNIASSIDIRAFDTATNSISISSTGRGDDYGSATGQMVVNPAGTRVYITDSNNNTIRILDVASNTVTANIKLKTAEIECDPYGIAINPAGTQLFIAGRDDQSLVHDCTIVIDTATKYSLLIIHRYYTAYM